MRAKALAIAVLSTLALGACATRADDARAPIGVDAADGGFEDIGYAAWDASEPAYQLFPGDEIELVVPSAPENNKVLTVQPDGRITLPLIGEMMVAARDLPDVRAEATRLYASQLRRPVVEMSLKAQPIKVFVGGEVGTPAVYDMIGDGDALRAIIQAGGPKPSANLGRVIIIRRGAQGQAMMRTTNLNQAFRHGDQPDFVPLARGDVVYVPRTGVAKVGLFMQQYLRDALPFTFSYAINGTYQ